MGTSLDCGRKIQKQFNPLFFSGVGLIKSNNRTATKKAGTLKGGKVSYFIRR